MKSGKDVNNKIFFLRDKTVDISLELFDALW